MKRKAGIRILLMAALLLLTVCGLASCGGLLNTFGGVAVESIQLESTQITIAPVGEASTLQLKPVIVPANATIQGVSYSVLNEDDKSYLTVNANGVIQALGEKEDGAPIVVRIYSNQSSDIFLDVYVTIGSANEAVKKIAFSPTSVHLNVMRNETYDASKTIQFTPWHAVVGRNVNWYSLNEAVCTVSSAGVITPVAPGITYVCAACPSIEGQETVSGQLEVQVTYAPLSYEMRAVDETDLSVMAQIVGSERPIRLELIQMDPDCDPSPTIRWYVDNERITTLEGRRRFDYTPVGKPYGTYTIRAEISNAFQSLTLEYEYKLHMYNPLTAFDVNVMNGTTTLQVRDTLQLQAGIPATCYEPEQFEWYMRPVDGDENRWTFVTTTSGRTLNYPLERTGTFLFRARAVIAGQPSIESISPAVTVEAQEEGTEIYDVYVEAYRQRDGNVVPAVFWRYPGYQANYRFEILPEDGEMRTMDNDAVTTGSAPMLLLPGLSLDDTFTVRVGTARFGWSAPVTYLGGTLSESDAAYFAPLSNVRNGTVDAGSRSFNFNGYISNIEEMGALLNYLCIYRPESLKTIAGDGSVNYTVQLKLPFRYSDLDAQAYPCGEDTNHLTGDALDFDRILRAAFMAYCESGEFQYGIETLGDGGVKLTLSFTSDPAEGTIATGQQGIIECFTPQHYTTKPNADEKLPVEYEKDARAKLDVSTTNQLIFALQRGLYPLPRSGSAAERIWNAARQVSLRIIDASMSERDKVHAIYDFLTTEVLYDYDLASLAMITIGTNQNLSNRKGFFAEGVFDDGVAVCDGIAKSFVLLCLMQGIAAVKVCGYVEPSMVDHAWNRVMVNGEWFVCDPTWGSWLSNDGVHEYQTHEYLLVSDLHMAQEHHVGYGKYPAANASANPHYANATSGPFRGTLETEADVRTGAVELAALMGTEYRYGYWEVCISATLARKLMEDHPTASSAVSVVLSIWLDQLATRGLGGTALMVGGKDSIYLVAQAT